jgi:hypothetical protein
VCGEVGNYPSHLAWIAVSRGLLLLWDPSNKEAWSTQRNMLSSLRKLASASAPNDSCVNLIEGLAGLYAMQQASVNLAALPISVRLLRLAHDPSPLLSASRLDAKDLNNIRHCLVTASMQTRAVRNRALVSQLVGISSAASTVGVHGGQPTDRSDHQTTDDNDSSLHRRIAGFHSIFELPHNTSQSDIRALLGRSHGLWGAGQYEDVRIQGFDLDTANMQVLRRVSRHLAASIQMSTPNTTGTTRLMCITYTTSSRHAQVSEGNMTFPVSRNARWPSCAPSVTL